MPPAGVALPAFLALTLLAPPPATACGAALHTEIARRAALTMSLPPAVEAIVRRHQGAVDAGAPFPDYLYACGGHSDDGEYAHWHEFHHHFVQHIRKTHPKWAEGDEHGAKLVAFLLGVASHYIADVNWHGLGQAQTGFIEQAGLADEGCNGTLCESAHGTCDTGAEFILAMQMSLSNFSPLNWWVPTDDIVKVFATANITVKASWIVECTALFAAEIEGIKSAEAVTWPVYAGKSPFLERNLEDFFVGGMDDSAAWTALVWAEVVDWLQGRGGGAPTLRRAAGLARPPRWSLGAAARGPWQRADPSHRRTEAVPEGAAQPDGGGRALPSPEAVLTSDASLSYAGSALAVCDVDGDGRQDWVVGAPGTRSSGRPLAGNVTVLFGGSSARSHSFAGEAVLARFGSALACADLDGNGFPELYVSAPAEGPWEITPRGDQDWYFENQTYSGAVHSFQWDGSAMAPVWTWRNDAMLALCGAALATTDSCIIVGCPYASNRAPWSGRVVALDLKGVILWEACGKTLGELLGTSLAFLPKLNLVAVGAPGFRGAALMTSGAVILLNATSGAEVLRVESMEAKAQFGQSVAADGSTLWVGAPGANITALLPAAGRVDQLLVQASADGKFSTTKQRSLEASLRGAFSHFGLAVTAIPGGGGVVVASPSTTRERGCVHIFSADGAERCSHEGPGASSRFGAALAVGKDVVLVGAPKESTGSHSDLLGDARQGRVYRYDLPKAELLQV